MIRKAAKYLASMMGLWLLVPATALAHGTRSSNQITWAPKQAYVSGLAGTQFETQVDFFASRKLRNVKFSVTGPVAKIVSLPAIPKSKVDAQTNYTLTLQSAIPADMPAATYQGSLSVRAHGRQISSLPIAVSVTTPSSNRVPQTPAEPADSRLTSWNSTTIVKDELVVGLANGSANPDQRIADIATQTHGVIMGSVPGTDVYQVRYPTVSTVAGLEALRTHLSGMPEVSFAGEHFLGNATETAPNDPLFDSWNQNLPSDNNWGFKYIHAPIAWSMTTGSKAVHIGIIDQAFQPSHEDLQANVTTTALSGDPGYDNAYAYHGNHVAGIACGSGNNGIGVAGMDWQCSLGMYSIGRKGDPMVALAMMQKAVDDHMQIINMSLQWVDNNNCSAKITSFTSDVVRMYDNILGRGIEYGNQDGNDPLWVMAAGNECRDVKYSAPASLATSYTSNVMAVAAVRQDGRLWQRVLGIGNGSDFGPGISVAAPGTSILSTLGSVCPRGPISCGPANNYGTKTGTSMAAPFVTGLAGLVLAEHPSYKGTQLKQCIVNAANSFGQAVPGQPFKVIAAPESVACSGRAALPQCVFESSTPSCESTNPDIIVKYHNQDDTSSCTFVTHVDWGDGTAIQTIPFSGGAPGSYVLGTHSYVSPGRYDIDITGEVSSGFCSLYPSAHTFTLVPSSP